MKIVSSVTKAVLAPAFILLLISYTTADETKDPVNMTISLDVPDVPIITDLPSIPVITALSGPGAATPNIGNTKVCLGPEFEEPCFFIDVPLNQCIDLWSPKEPEVWSPSTALSTVHDRPPYATVGSFTPTSHAMECRLYGDKSQQANSCDDLNDSTLVVKPGFGNMTGMAGSPFRAVKCIKW